MSSYQKENKRIAKNTIIVYANMFIGMAIGLYTSRLVLQALGVSDYGLYNVVGGVIAMFLFMLGSLSTTTTRFINVEMGKQDGDLNKVFNVCNVLHISLALIVLIFAEVIGVWYINNYLNVEAGKEDDAMFIFQYSIIVSCIGITNVPFASLFNATEKFLFNAFVHIGLKVLQLLLVIWLVYYEGNKIRAYAVMMSVSTFVTFVVYHYYSFRYWPKVIKWKFVRNFKLYKEALVFNNYNLLSAAALMGRSQGSNLLINFFFGTTVNGAYAIAKTVESYVMIFTGNFDAAAAPQITQNYSAGNMDRVMSVVCKVGKYCILLMMVAFFPLYAEIEFVLNLWLVKVPEGAVVFCKMTLLIAFVSSTSGGILHVVNASGKIAKFKTTFSFLMLLCLPISYYMFKQGAAAYTMLGLFVIVDVVWRIIQLYYLKIIIRFNIIDYLKRVYLPPTQVAFIITALIIITSYIPIDGIPYHLFRFLFILCSSLITIYMIGLNIEERRKIYSVIKDKIVFCKK